MKSSVFPILFSLFFAFTLHSSTEAPPFSVNVLVEEGENVVDWEEGIFGDKAKKKKEDEKDVKKPEKAEDKKEAEKEETKTVENTQEKTENSEPDEEDVLEEEPDPDVEKEQKEYDSKDPKWGRYYGEAPEIKKKYHPVDVDKKEGTEKKTAIIKDVSDKEFIPVDILLWSQGGDGYLAMINTGVRVSYLNMYSTLSVGTDYSASLERPMSLGLNFGGYYRIDDFLITADLGYEKIWDFGDNPELNDYALGLKAGLSYNIWSWVSISAGAGLNYNVLKDTAFEKGKFAPMFFGGFEFNLMK